MRPQPLLLLLTPITSSIGTPTCIHPAPPPSSLPTVSDCNAVLDFIEAVARVQHNNPYTWSRHPPRIDGRELPVYFSGSGSDCEFVVDVKGAEDEADVFPTGDLVFIGRDIVESCLVGKGGREKTVGEDVVGPRGVVVVRMRRRGLRGVELVNGTLLLGGNGTEGVRMVRELEEARNVSGTA